MYMTASYELYIEIGNRYKTTPKCVLWYRFKYFPNDADSVHSMGRYRSICDFGVFVKVEEAVPEGLKTLNFDELTKLHSSLPHLQSHRSKDEVIKCPSFWGGTWRLYDPRTEPALQL
jgi:hypothetical protein